MKTTVKDTINVYPEAAIAKFYEIRALIFKVAKSNGVGLVDETLKWNQPSYLCKPGSTIRIDWRETTPDSMDILFNCKTILVETFKEIFGDRLSYVGNRVVVVQLDQPLPPELKTCILMALNYHKLKKLPLLGA